MSSLAVRLSHSTASHADDPATSVHTMLTAAPHRGDPENVAVRAGCAIGISRRDYDANSAAVAATEHSIVGFEGRLDNRSELAHSLGLPADAPIGQLIAEGFDAYREGLASRMRGRYCVAVSDGESLWAWRDHLGFGPAFYRVDEGGAYLATEAKQVAAGAGIGVAPDLTVVERILWGDFDDETPSAVRGVQRLAKASLLVIRQGRARTSRYWRPEDLLETRGRVAVPDLQDEFDALMSQACSRMLTGEDVVSLSGGMDSPAVAAYASPAYRRMTGRRLPAVSTVYPDYPRVDESSWVRLVADELDLDLETVPHEVDGIGRLDVWTKRFDGPVPALWITDLATQYQCCASRGMRTVLTGEIAEFVTDMRGSLVAHLLRHGRVGAVVRELGRQRRRGVRVNRLVRQAAVTAVPRRAMSLAIRHGWLDGTPPAPWIDGRRLREIEARTVVSPAQSWADWQSGAFVGPGLSIEADDVVQAVTGVTSRRPWADVDLWEWFLRLRAETKFPNDRRKGIARTLLRGRVPDQILDRRDKTYFNDTLLGNADYAELERWLRRPAHRFAGIDYPALAEALDRRDLDLPAYVWAKNLATAHAFVEAC